MNKLILGDCLEVLQKIESESVDLIYIDPPFFSNRTYEVIWGDKGEVRSFEDRFSGGIDHYIAWLKFRIEELHRILKPTGSIFVHCDHHANAYIRVFILDKIFAGNNFRNEIIWQRTNNPKGSQFEKKNLGVATDTIWWYSKSENYTFQEHFIRETLQNGELAKKYPYFDEKGRYYQGPIFCSKSMGDRPNLCYEYKGINPPHPSGWRLSKAKLEELDNAGNLGWSRNGKPFRKLRPENDKGNPIYNFWSDIKRIYGGSSEMIGYPTQKPEKLLERIVLMASKEGDTVLDCFMGGGTTVAVADKLGRNWIGIDQSEKAIEVTNLRMKKQNAIFEKSQVNSLYLPLNKENILKFLKDHKDFLAKKFHINQIALFGSFAKNEQNPDSDVDLLVDFEQNITELLFVREDLRTYLSEKLKRSVDLVSSKTIHPYFKENILKNALFI